MRAIRSLTSFVACAAVVLVASSAVAVNNYTLAGRLTASRGKNTNVPLAGNTTCGSLSFLSGPGMLARGQNTQPKVAVTPAFQWRKDGLDQGCVKHAAGVVLPTTGKVVGGAFTLPAQAFKLPYPKNRAPAFYMAATDIPVAEIKFFPPVVQIATSVSITAPPAARLRGLMDGGTQCVTMGTNTCTNAAKFRRFKTGAWATQTGRAGPDFTWCPPGTGALGGPGSPGCNPPPYPGFAGYIKYNGSTNSFGGTMSYVTHQGSGVGSIAFLLGAFVGFNPFGGGEELGTGRGYADYNQIVLPMGERFKGAGASATSIGTRYIGPVLKSEKVLGMVASKMDVGDQPGGKVYTWGFPWTTMTVVQRASKGGQKTTFTAMGWDCAGTMQGPACSVAPTMGLPKSKNLVQRNISLVAGSVSISRFSTGDTPAVNLASMQILPEPGTTLQLLAGVGALLGIAAWRSRRVH